MTSSLPLPMKYTPSLSSGSSPSSKKAPPRGFYHDRLWEIAREKVKTIEDHKHYPMSKEILAWATKMQHDPVLKEQHSCIWRGLRLKAEKDIKPYFYYEVLRIMMLTQGFIKFTKRPTSDEPDEHFVHLYHVALHFFIGLNILYKTISEDNKDFRPAETLQLITQILNTLIEKKPEEIASHLKEELIRKFHNITMAELLKTKLFNDMLKDFATCIAMDGSKTVKAEADPKAMDIE